MFRLLFQSNNTDVNSIISSVVLSSCINILSLSLFNAWCDILGKNSAKASLDVSAFPPRYMFSAANAWIETNPCTSELLNFSKSWIVEIILSVFIKYGISGLGTTIKYWEPGNLPWCWKDSEIVPMIFCSKNSPVSPKLIKWLFLCKPRSISFLSSAGKFCIVFSRYCDIWL